MKSSIRLDSKIQSFWARKTDQYPDLNQTVNRLYRDLLREERLEHSTYRRLAGEDQAVNLQYRAGRFTGNHFRGLHYAQ